MSSLSAIYAQNKELTLEVKMLRESQLELIETVNELKENVRNQQKEVMDGVSKVQSLVAPRDIDDKCFFISIPGTKNLHHEFYKNIGDNNLDNPKNADYDKTIDWKAADCEFFKILCQRLKKQVVILKREKGETLGFIDDGLMDEQFGKILFSNDVEKKINWLGKKATPEILFFIWLLTEKYKIIDRQTDLFFENIPRCFKSNGKVMLKDPKSMENMKGSYYRVKRTGYLNEKTKGKIKDIITATARDVHRYHLRKR